MSLRIKVLRQIHNFLASHPIPTNSSSSLLTFLQNDFRFKSHQLTQINPTATFLQILPLLYAYSNLSDELEAVLLRKRLNKLECIDAISSFWSSLTISAQEYEGSNFKCTRELNFEEFITFWIPAYLQMIRSEDLNTQTMVYTPNYVVSYMYQLLDFVRCDSKYNNFIIEDPNQKKNGGWDFYDPAVGSYQFEYGLLSFLEQKGYSRKIISHFLSSHVLGHEIDEFSYLLGHILFRLHLEANAYINETDSLILNTNAIQDPYQKWNGIPNLLEHPDHPLAIIGNPPYSVSSLNKGQWITSLMSEYRVPEPNLTRLYDDYVKFIRYGQWLLEHRDQGILLYISNRKFLDGKIYYGMRKSLFDTFSKIFIIDLKGDSRNRKEIRNDPRSQSENIFGIQTGICISCFVKGPSITESLEKKIYYRSIEGTIPQIQSVFAQPIQKQDFLSFSPAHPSYLFVPIHIQDTLKQLWENHMMSLPKVFQDSSRALITSRDRFMIHIDRKELEWNLDQLQSGHFDNLRQKKRIKTKYDTILENPEITKDFNFKKMHESIQPITYRPFDMRYVIHYTINRRCGSSQILSHLSNKSSSLSSSLHEIFTSPAMGCDVGFNFVQSMQTPPYNHFFVTRGLVDSGLFGYSTSKVAPLWMDGKLNLNPELQTQFTQFWKDCSPEDIFGYIYGVLQSPIYAMQFEPYLLHQYPRLMFPKKLEVCKRISSFGKELLSIHLYIGIEPRIEKFIHQYPDLKWSDSPLIWKATKYDLSKNLLHLNYFSSENKHDHNFSLSIPLKVWKFRIGSVSVIKHWLVARTKRLIKPVWSKSDWIQFLMTVMVCEETIRVKDQLDQILKEEFPQL